MHFAVLFRAYKVFCIKYLFRDLLFVLDCGDPSPVNGLSEAPRGTTYGEVAILTCNDGFSRTGSAFVTCRSNGTWSGVAICTETGCRIF